MTLLFNTNARMALQSIRANRLRSTLTMIGIIIGVASVITMVALGEGFRRQVADTNQAGNQQLVTVRPGQLVDRDEAGNITSVNLLAALGANSLTNKDYESLKGVSEARSVTPLATISGVAKDFDGEVFKNGTIIATTSGLPEAIGQKIAYGSFFNDDQNGRNVAVIGKRVAEELFKENVPLGKLISVRGQDFIVGGVFEEFKTNPLSTVTDLNKAVFLSYQVASSLTGSEPNIFQFLLLPKESNSSTQLADAARNILLANHGQQEDFTVLKASETEEVARDTANIATAFVAGIAAISLLVGGIGIMNIMFVSVTERTREIGVRKSLGATNRQIYSQFLIEAAVLSLVGGIFGILVALGASAVVGILTELQPMVTWQIVLLAVGVSAAVGILFGTAPAVKAARKDPIEALRYE